MTQIHTRPDWLEGHGSPSDRGGADAYYGRPYDPHYWPEGTYKGTRVSASDTVSYTHLTLPTKA